MPSKLEQQWIEQFVETGDAQQAVRDVYPDCGSMASDPDQAVRIRSSQLKKKLALDIDKRLREELAGDSVKMLTIIKGIATSAMSEAVKLNAAKDWLDRAGYKPVDETRELPQTDGDQLRAQLKSDLTALGVPEEMAEKIIAGEQVMPTPEVEH